MKKTSVFLSILLIIQLFVGCGNNSNTVSFDYDKYIKEQAKLEKLQPVIWLYGSDRFCINDQFWNYYAEVDKKIKVQLFSEEDMDLSLFQTKLQVSLMGKDGPDLVLTENQDLLDVQKIIAAGAFTSWDDILSELDTSEYYTSAVDNLRYSDGKAYLLPLCFDPDLIVTTKSNMKKYGFTEDDFSDFYKTTDCILRIWKMLEQENNNSSFAFVNTPSILRSIPSIIDWNSKKTGLLDTDVQQTLSKWGSMLPYRKKCTSKATWLFENGEVLFDGSRVLDFTTYNELKSILGMRSDGSPADHAVSYISAKQFDELVFFPLRNTEGKVTGTIKKYALLPANCKNPDTIKAYILDYIRKDETGGIGAMLGTENESKQIALLKYDIGKKMQTILQQPMALTLDSATIRNYEMRLSPYFNGIKEFSSEDWRDLETDINIYLSE